MKDNFNNAKQAAMSAMGAPGAMDAPTTQDSDMMKMMADMSAKIDQILAVMQGTSGKPMGGM